LPSTNQNEFSVINLPDGEVQISVYDLNGKLYYIDEFSSEEGEVSNVKININGMGLFSIITKYGLISKKVIVK